MTVQHLVNFYVKEISENISVTDDGVDYPPNPVAQMVKNLPAMQDAAAKSIQSCLTLCDPIDGSPPGFPIPGILQARALEWAAISFSTA